MKLPATIGRNFMLLFFNTFIILSLLPVWIPVRIIENPNQELCSISRPRIDTVKFPIACLKYKAFSLRWPKLMSSSLCSLLSHYGTFNFKWSNVITGTIKWKTFIKIVFIFFIDSQLFSSFLPPVSSYCSI